MGVDHDLYPHSVIIEDPVRAALMNDLDIG